MFGQERERVNTGYFFLSVTVESVSSMGVKLKSSGESKAPGCSQRSYLRGSSAPRSNLPHL